MGNLYAINNGAVTLYVTSYNGKTYKLDGFIVDNDPENYYVNSSFVSETPTLEGKKDISIKRYLFDMFIKEADTQLQQYISKHINDYRFYSQTNDCGEFTFWNRSVIYSSSFKKKFNSRLSISLREVANGIVSMEINNTSCEYNFVEKKITGFKQRGVNAKPGISAMELFYGNNFNGMIAAEQYKRGITPPAYKEFMDLAIFLSDKKSVKMLMKSGDVHELKKDYIDINDILFVYSSAGELKFMLENHHGLRPRIESKLPLGELDYLLHGKQTHYINETALMNYKSRDA